MGFVLSTGEREKCLKTAKPGAQKRQERESHIGFLFSPSLSHVRNHDNTGFPLLQKRYCLVRFINPRSAQLSSQ